MRHRQLIFQLAATATLLALSPQSFSQAASAEGNAEAAANASTKGLVIRDLSIVVIDPNLDDANDETLFGSSLPSFARTRRAATEVDDPFHDQPIPLGLITLDTTLSTEEVDRFDVLLEIEDGRLLGGWPAPTQRRHSRLLWRNAELAENQSPPHLAESHWLSPLRHSERRALALNRQAERFILYDFKMKAANNVTLESAGQPGQFRATIKGENPLDHLTLLEFNGEGYLTATHEPQLAMGTAPSSDTETEDAEGEVSNSNTALLTLSASPIATLEEALTPLVQALSKRGMTDVEIRYALSVVQAQAQQQTGLLMLHLADPQTLEQRLPIEVTPEPAALYRASLVIVVNADPALADQIDQLILELGNDSWMTREHAQNQLMRLGQAALPRLEAANTKDDPEIAYRVQQLLEILQ